jgi:hypothetical protein
MTTSKRIIAIMAVTAAMTTTTAELASAQTVTADQIVSTMRSLAGGQKAREVLCR